MAYRLHLESRRAQSSAFHLDETAWKLASTRHKHLASLVEASFGWDGEQLRESLEGASGLIASKIDKRTVNDAKSLRWIHTTGAGVDQLLPLSDLRDDLTVSNSSGIHSDKAGESALMAMLMLNGRMPEVVANQHRHVWQPYLTSPIRGKRVVIVGFGDIGRAVGTAALAVGLDVIAITRSGKAAAALTQVPVATMAEIDLYLPTADFLVITAPLTEETRGFMNRERFALLRPTAALINMARAGLVDYPALADRLRKGLLGGAVLDVFDDEPLPAESPYWDVPGLLVMPHITCDAPDYSQRVLDLWFDNFERLLAGEPLLNQVDRERGY